MINSATYFSPEEFMIMLEIAGKSQCSVLLEQTDFEDAALTQAFVALSRRNFICWQEDGFRISENGHMFHDMRCAPFIVLIFRQERQATAICYIDKDKMWLTELTDMIIRKQYRVRILDWEGLHHWLSDSELLTRPILREEDTLELSAALAKMDELPGGNVLLRLEKYINGGQLLKAFEVRHWYGKRLIVRYDTNRCQTTLYTVQAFEQMMMDCFGKENYDYC